MGKDISIHAPHARSDALDLVKVSDIAFQSTLLMRGATRTASRRAVSRHEFQSTLLMRGATVWAAKFIAAVAFQSTLLMRGATRVTDPRRTAAGYFNPRSSCEERHYRLVVGLSEEEISIHAPHARSDQTARIRSSDSAFQSTLLMRGATSLLSASMVGMRKFQSTLLMRGATNGI